ncbi:MAG: HNH endonuclease signature motif containing protein [Patescibacteria group bacterium]
MANKTRQGNDFTLQQRQTVWAKAQSVLGKDDNYKLDPCGALMVWSEYGKTVENGTGWEIDHIKPISKGGTDDPWNLQALQWEHNRKKADGPNMGYCMKKWTGK